MKKILCIILAIVTTFMVSISAKNNERQTLGRPDLQAIAEASIDEESEFYYPRLLTSFMSNDTTMTSEQFQYFYYGTLFQEDYDPYREAPNKALLQELLPIYAKHKRTRSDREKMLDYALMVLEDNPLDLRQLTNRIYVYEQNRKYDLAKIWQYKLNHLLLVIASSGTGIDADNAFTIVYPQHEYDFLNLSGMTASSQRFEPPCYDFITVIRTDPKKPDGYFFNISEMLNQYFLKHPSELTKDSGEE